MTRDDLRWLTLSRRMTHYRVVEYLNVLNILCMEYVGNISSRFSSNSEARASELQEDLEEMFPRFYMGNNAINRFKYSCYREKVN